MTYRDDFPVFKSREKFHYLDSAATTQRPAVVIEAVKKYYENYNGNAGRGSNWPAIKSGLLIESAREKVRAFINARMSDEIVFTKNATEALNIISSGLAENLSPGDEILIPVSNHHANLVNWRHLAKKTGAVIRYIPIDINSEIIMDEYRAQLSDKTKIVAFSAVVNSNGIINPSKKIIEYARRHGAITVCDAAQAVAHFPVDVQDLDCDFLVFSGHKIFSEFGAGVLYGRYSMLDQLPPLLYGGDMIEYVDMDSTTYKAAPQKFEGGTQNTAAIHSLEIAIDYINKIGYNDIADYLAELEEYACQRLEALPFVKVYHREAKSKTSIIAFNVEAVHSHDTSHILDQFGVYVRSGHHCTQPLMKRFGINSTLRVSLSIYNNREDVDALIEGLKKVADTFEI